MPRKNKCLQIGLIDYGMGNLHSVSKALSLQGDRVLISDSVKRLRGSDYLVLPGVGAFGAAMLALAKKKLDDLIFGWISDRKPYLGICLGFQLLFSRSDESPGVEGLGYFKGRVVSFKKSDFNGKPFNIPHMGWNSVVLRNSAALGVFKGVKPSDTLYFVHSYFPEPVDPSIIGSETKYGRSFCSSVATASLFASQFHPEKSGQVGLKLIHNILDKRRQT